MQDEGIEWQRLAEKISKALYGPVKSQVGLPGKEIADIVVWDSSIRKDARGGVKHASRIIECKVSALTSLDEVIGKYLKYCNVLEIWYLRTSHHSLKAPFPTTSSRVICKGPHELLSALLARGALGKRWVADLESRKALAKEMWNLKWEIATDSTDLIVCPRKLLCGRGWGYIRTPLGPYVIEKTVRPAALQHFSEVPVALLDAAGKTGRWDDMTVVALRLLTH